MFEYFKALQETGRQICISTTLAEDAYTKCTVKVVFPDCIIIKTKSGSAYLIAMAQIVDVYLGDAHD